MFEHGPQIAEHAIAEYSRDNKVGVLLFIQRVHINVPKCSWSQRNFHAAKLRRRSVCHPGLSLAQIEILTIQISFVQEDFKLPIQNFLTFQNSFMNEMKDYARRDEYH